MGDMSITRNGIRLGPGSPLLPSSGERAENVKRARHALPGSANVEHVIQSELFDKINDPAEQLRRPELALVHAVPNGGKRAQLVAVKLKAEGVKPGVPDIDCPVARGGYFGLRIEMKRPGASTTPEQAHWLSAFAREGYKVALHTTTEGAWQELVNYLDEPRTEVLRPSSILV